MNLRAQPARFLISFFLCFLFSLAIDIAAGHPRLVDEPISLGLWISIFLHLLLWLLGMVSWGSLIWKWTSGRESHCPEGISFAIGSLSYALVGFAFATVGLLRPEIRFFLFILQSVGIALATPGKIELNGKLLLALIPLLALFVLFFVDALVISSYWDPLHHQLASVRLFWERGKMYFPRDAIASYQEGGFEMLFLWPHFFFAQAGGKGLLPVQLFAQLTHLMVGFGGSLAVAHAFAKRWLPSAPWQALAILLFAAPASLQFAIPTAKNEWGIILWVLAGFWLLTSSSKNESNLHRHFRLAIAGIFWGFAFLAKLSCGFALAGLLAYFIFRPMKNPRDILAWGTGILIGAAPLALRNYRATGDPLFPLFPHFFHLTEKVMGPTWYDALAKYSANPLGFARLREWTEEFPLAASVLLLPLLALIRKEDPALRAASIAIPLGAIFFSFFSGTATELRLAGTLLPLSALVLVVLLQRFSTRLPVPNAGIGWALVAVLAVLLPYRWEALPRARAIPFNHLLVRGYVSGEAQGWVRDHFKKGMRTALLSESRFYHSIPFSVIRIWDSPLLDAKLRQSKDPKDFLNILKREGYSHLIISQEKLDLFFPRALVSQVESYVLQHPETFVFQAKFSIVADLSKF